VFLQEAIGIIELIAGDYAMAAHDSTLELRIDTRVVRQLGAELITDPEQALLELVKNSYDADADRCRVQIDTNAKAYFALGDRLETPLR